MDDITPELTDADVQRRLLAIAEAREARRKKFLRVWLPLIVLVVIGTGIAVGWAVKDAADQRRHEQHVEDCEKWGIGSFDYFYCIYDE